MNYIFQVREWTVEFYLSLEKELFEKNKESSFFWITMNKSVENKIKRLKKNVFYLPELFEINSHNIDELNTRTIDEYMYKKYNYGIEFLYEMERFKPNQKFKSKFICGHINALMEIIPPKAKMISLTCDHFIFFISAYINEFKGGTNYFIQPIGFPKNAQIIMHNPWDINYFRKESLSDNSLNQYVESLNLDPKVSIHYMKPQKMISLKHSILKRLKDLTINKTENSIFTYLEPQRNNIVPSRFRQKKKINYPFNYLLESDIKKTAQKCNLFYFPLQFEPEMSILAYSPWYKDQLEVIRLISQSLKTGDILLLKENPKMIGKRKNDYYDYITSFANIRWADPDINSRQIIRNSFKVISITGTATIEAACLGINSLIFGCPPFRNMLLEKPVAEQPLYNFIKKLYKTYTKDEIIENVRINWSEFSKGLFFGNFVPTYINNKLTLNNSDIMAEKFVNEVLN